MTLNGGFEEEVPTLALSTQCSTDIEIAFAWHNPRKGRDQILPSGNTAPQPVSLLAAPPAWSSRAEDVFHGPHFDELTTEKFATEVAYRHNGSSCNTVKNKYGLCPRSWRISANAIALFLFPVIS